MKAVARDRYGPPEMLELRDRPKPQLGPTGLLVRVQAASVNSWDWDLLVGNALGRIGSPFRPRHKVLGADVAGIVEAVGPKVTRFRPGDAVFGDVSGADWGGFAEFVAADEIFFAAKPDTLSFVEAAAIPQAGSLALQAIRFARPLGRREARPLEPGQHLLINGAGGGVGSFALQLGKAMGVEVTGVDHRTKHDFMRSLGADHVIDYRDEDFTRTGLRYDRIIDMVARRPRADYARALTQRGVLVVVGGTIRTLLSTVFLGDFLGRGPQAFALLMWKYGTDDLEALKTMIAEGTIRPAIDMIYPLERTADALRHVGEARARGKVLVQVAE